MASWDEVCREAPALVTAARARFDAHRHKLVATVRRDGAPRISGVETTFAHGELWLGMMPGSRKGEDLHADPRLALHSGSADPDDTDPSAWPGDAKLAGRAVAVHDPDTIARFVGEQAQMPPGPFELFRVDVADLTVIRIGYPADHLVVESWSDTRGITRVERR